MLINEVILKNFMSYEYARIPLKNGVNVISGPNGSGKSSLLLGICVALGDTYTERSKKLSDLIRWGEDLAETSLILNNRKRSDGYRPLPRFNMDEFMLTRYLRRDGKYWFELNHRNITKAEVIDLLNNFGFDPSNMLIIMHQAMPTRFASMSPKDRLHMLEEAVGFETFREDVLEAKKKLGSILSEEESLNNLLERARETLNYWQKQNQRLNEKKQFQTRMTFLQRGLAWARVISLEGEHEKIKEQLEKTQNELFKVGEEIELNFKRLIESEESIKKLWELWYKLIDRRIEYERLLGFCEQGINSVNDQLVYLERLIKISQEQRETFDYHKRNLNNIKSDADDQEYFRILNEIGEQQQKTYQSFREEFLNQRSHYESKISQLTKQLMQVEEELVGIIEEMNSHRNKVEKANEDYVERRIKMALLRDVRTRLEKSIENLKSEIEIAGHNIMAAEAEALQKGQRIETGRNSEEILEDIRFTSGKLLALADIPGEAEEMYIRYKETFIDIQDKVEQIRENRIKVTKEIQERTKKWHELINKLLEEVNIRYQSLLLKLRATGEVRLMNPSDIEEAGLEIYVGFRGAQQNRLDPYTHSGGERSTSVMAFLLALQQNIISPFRAVDEFDLHMDPKNKELVSEFIVSTMENASDQYMAITPGQVAFHGSNIHIIMVHKTDEISNVRLVKDS
jgi:chromosome segregation ATPase